MSKHFNEEFGQQRFDDKVMEQVLDKATLKAFYQTRATGIPMGKADGNRLAAAMMEWAQDQGCRCYAHWFSPVRGGNGLKHDAFIDLDYKGKGQQNSTVKDAINTFSASQLFYNETDGSSFPNGGLRVTHRAAAFMNWDTSSPPFVRNETLYIPAAFVSHGGHALDHKTIMLRSQDALSRAGVRLMHAIGDTDVNDVVANVGWEQEFFLIDRDLYNKRPDLVACGRTLIGAPPSRGQQTDYNYFNKVPPRSREFFDALQRELWAIGVTMTTFHNEVAPAQVEFCPIFKVTNIAADENALAMEIMEDLAVKFNLKVLTHEKPFAGINGSGKHCNWGVNTDTGINLLTPGKTTESQARFITCVAALARAVHVHGDALRVGVATAGNDHRLGAQEAPPAIISLYTGDVMEDHIRKIIAGGALGGYGAGETDISFGTSKVPPLKARLEDRNRTAPFPFCGNRFEFRAVGANQNINFPLAILNTAYAESMQVMATEIEGGTSVRDVVAEMFKRHMPAIFNGNGYAPEWQTEAASRGLKNLKSSPDAYAGFASDKNIALFSSQLVMSAEEVHARKDILEEEYVLTVEIEASCLLKMIDTAVLPTCAKDLKTYAGTGLGKVRQEVYAAVDSAVNKLREVHAGLNEAENSPRYCVDVLLPAMAEVRKAADRAEGFIEKSLHPIPSYEDVLFFHLA